MTRNHISRALADLPDDQLAQLMANLGRLSAAYFADDHELLGDLLHGLAVTCDEEISQRRALAEHARRELDGDDTGEIWRGTWDEP